MPKGRGVAHRNEEPGHLIDHDLRNTAGPRRNYGPTEDQSVKQHRTHAFLFRAEAHHVSRRQEPVGVRSIAEDVEVGFHSPLTSEVIHSGAKRPVPHEQRMRVRRQPVHDLDGGHKGERILVSDQLRDLDHERCTNGNAEIGERRPVCWNGQPVDVGPVGDNRHP